MRGLLHHFMRNDSPRTLCGRSRHSRQRDVLAMTDPAEFRALPDYVACARCRAALDTPARAKRTGAAPRFVIEGVNRVGAAMSIPDCTAADVRFWKASQNFTVTAVHEQVTP